MKRVVMVCVGALVFGIGVGLIASQLLMAQAPPVKRTPLQQADLEGVPGKEIIMYMAELSPGAVAGRHFHPGPEVAYVLEGTLVVEPDGKPPLTLNKGESFHNPAKNVHNARNGSTTAPAKVLVVLIGEKGAALSTPAQ